MGRIASFLRTVSAPAAPRTACSRPEAGRGLSGIRCRGVSHCARGRARRVVSRCIISPRGSDCDILIAKHQPNTYYHRFNNRKRRKRHTVIHRHSCIRHCIIFSNHTITKLNCSCAHHGAPHLVRSEAARANCSCASSSSSSRGPAPGGGGIGSPVDGPPTPPLKSAPRLTGA